jgi:tRNA-binding protein
LVIAVVSLPPRRIAGFKSEVLVLGVRDASGNVILLEPEREAPLGERVF